MKFLNLLHKFTSSLLGWAPITFVIAICPGVTAAIISTWEDTSKYQKTNAIPEDIIGNVFLLSVLLFLGVLIVYAAGATVLKIWKQRSVIDTIKVFNKYGLILWIVPLFLTFEIENLAKNHPIVTLFTSATIAIICGVYTYRLALSSSRFSGIKPKYVTLFSMFIILAAATAFAVTIFKFQVVQHQALKTGNFDLGVYVNTLWNSLHGSFLKTEFVRGGYHIYAHFDPILILFSPVMLFNPSPENALLTQTIWLALGVFPIYLITMHHLNKNWIAIALCITYLLYPGIHGMSMYEFHSLALAGPFLLWSLYFIETKRLKLYFVSLILLLLTREDLSFIMFFVGFYIFYDKKYLRLGITTMILCIIYFVTVKSTIMTADDSYSYDYYFSKIRLEDKSLAYSMLVTLFTNPMHLVRQVLAEHKVLYVLQLLVPLAFLPLLGGKRLFTCLYGIAITFLVSRKAVCSIAYQYPTFLYPFFFAMVPAVLSNIEEFTLVKKFNIHSNRLVAALAIAILASTVCVSYNFGVFHENTAFRAGHSKFERIPTEKKQKRYKVVKKLQTMVPDESSVSATLFIGTHFAIRDSIFQFKKLEETDYYIVYDSDIRDKFLRKKYKKFLRKMPYDLIFNEMNLKLFIRRDLNKGKYPVLRISR